MTLINYEHKLGGVACVTTKHISLSLKYLNSSHRYFTTSLSREHTHKPNSLWNHTGALKKTPGDRTSTCSRILQMTWPP